MVFGFYVDWMVFVAWHGITSPRKNFYEEQYFFLSLLLSTRPSFSSKVRNGDRNYTLFRRTGRLPGWIRLLLVSVNTM